MSNDTKKFLPFYFIHDDDFSPLPSDALMMREKKFAFFLISRQQSRRCHKMRDVKKKGSEN
jgi:hypothetical protein